MGKDIKFSFSRMAQVLQRDIQGDLKRNIYNVVLLYGILLLPLLGILIFSDDMTLEDVSGKFRIVVVLVFFWGSLYVATGIMKPMRSKGGRLSFLMLPATNAEKFVARFLIVTVGYIVAFAAAMIALDLTYQIITFVFLFGSDCYGSLVYGILPSSYDSISGTIFLGHYTRAFDLSMVFLLLLSLLQHSLYIFGGSLWYKLSFVKTLAATYILGFVVSVVVFLIKYIFPVCIESYDAILLTVSVLAVCVALALYFLSYRLFTRAQIISRYNFILQ